MPPKSKKDWFGEKPIIIQNRWMIEGEKRKTNYMNILQMKIKRCGEIELPNERVENAFLYLTHTIEKHLRFISLSSSSFTLFLHPLHFNASSWNSCIGIAGFMIYKAILATAHRISVFITKIDIIRHIWERQKMSGSVKSK